MLGYFATYTAHIYKQIPHRIIPFRIPFNLFDDLVLKLRTFIQHRFGISLSSSTKKLVLTLLLRVGGL